MLRFDWSSNLTKRLCTGLAIIAGLAVVFAFRILTVWIFDAVALFLAAVAVWEMMRARKSDERGVAFAYVFSYVFIAYGTFLIGILTDFSWWLHVVMQISAIAIFALYTFIMNYMDQDFVKESKLKKVSTAKNAAVSVREFLFVVVYPFLMLFLLIPINHLGEFATYIPAGGEESVTAAEVGTFALLLIFFISCFTDTFAYCTGFALRGPKLCPKISPKKTITGAVGGLFGGVIGALLVILIFVPNGSALQGFLTERVGDTVVVQAVFISIGLLGSAATQIGDLAASLVKRRMGIKDFGNYLPGHGGAMDRLDGISFNTVLIFIAFVIICFA